MENYYITITDYYNQQSKVKVSYEVYQIYEAARKETERARYERRVHLDCRELDDTLIANQAVTEKLEESYLQRENLREVYEVLKSCTPVQRERFYLNRICGYSCREIACMQGCHNRAVEKSVNTVLKKIENYFERG